MKIAILVVLIVLSLWQILDNLITKADWDQHGYWFGEQEPTPLSVVLALGYPMWTMLYAYFLVFCG